MEEGGTESAGKEAKVHELLAKESDNDVTLTSSQRLQKILENKRKGMLFSCLFSMFLNPVLIPFGVQGTNY